MQDTAPALEYATIARPTRARFSVVGFCVALAMVTYLDRVCISTMSADIMRDLSLSEKQMGRVFSAFAVAYALFEIPTAWWADRLGTRRVLTRIIVWWSMLTMATGASIGCLSMLLTRFLFGVGEAGAWPCVAATFSRWIPSRDRGTAQGIFFAGAHLSGALTPMLVIFLMNYLHWRAIFVICGSVGFVWAAAWYFWYRDDPSQHSSVNSLELAEIVAGRREASSHWAPWAYWRRLLLHRNTWPLCLMYVGNSYAFYFCITWLPTYLEQRHGVSKAMLGLAGLPLGLGVLGDLFGGFVTDWMCRRFGLRMGRAGLGAVAYTLAAVSMFFATRAAHPTGAIILLSLAVALVMFTLGAAWSTCIDIGGHHTGVVSAFMNTAGNFGGIFSPIVAIWAKDHFHSWDAPLYVIGALFVVGAVCWCFIDSRDRVFD